MCTLHDFTCVLLSVMAQDVERKGKPVNLTAFSLREIVSKLY